MKTNDLVLRCYAEPDKDGSWFAICLDLNLYARGDNFNEVRVKLNRLISSYVREAVEKDAEYIEDLIPRRAPLYFWMRYLVARCFGNRHPQADSFHRFKLPLPMIPAY